MEELNLWTALEPESRRWSITLLGVDAESPSGVGYEVKIWTIQIDGAERWVRTGRGPTISWATMRALEKTPG